MGGSIGESLTSLPPNTGGGGGAPELEMNGMRAVRVCLRRVCLVRVGKLLQHFRAFETHETLAHDEMLQSDRRGSRMLALDRRYIKVRLPSAMLGAVWSH